MEKFLFIVFICALAFFLSIFAFSNILFPIFYALPRAKKLEKEGKLKKPIPLCTFLLAPFFWLFLVIVGCYFLYINGLGKIGYVVGIALLHVIVNAEKKDKEGDFLKTWGEYLS